MTLKEYQEKSRVTALYPNQGNNYIYPVLGLNGEAGEVAEKIKKVLRDKNGIVSEEDRQEIAKELGDVLWYLSQLASEFKLELDDIAQNNINKLYSRMERGVLHGNGDNR
ncbi:MAG: nucleoside triphosphate pyrophosphohydrolase family protein [Candidatus Falkowbacteria bacterium]